MFALLWGVPYLVAGQGLTPAAASGLLTVFVIAGIAAGPLFGEFTARRPLHRSWLVLAVILGTAMTWTVVLALPPPVPRWLLVVLVVVLALGAPGSMIGFDYARTFNPDHHQGTAVGIVNVGGFVASLLVSLAIGVVLGLVSPTGGYTPEGFRVAWTVQYVVWGVALVGVLLARRRARRKLEAAGVVIPRLREVLAARRPRAPRPPVGAPRQRLQFRSHDCGCSRRCGTAVWLRGLRGLLGQQAVDRLPGLGERRGRGGHLLRRAGTGDLVRRRVQLLELLPQLRGVGVDVGSGHVPHRVQLGAVLLDVAAAFLGEPHDAPALGLLDGHQAFVLELRERRVDRAGARAPGAVGALGDLLDDLVAVPRLLGDEREDGGADVAA